jgi:hypothetical protein
MGYFIRTLLYLTAVSCAFAQLDSNSLTVSVSRNKTLQADQAVFGVFVSTDFTAGLNDVLAAVETAGITMANFVSVSSSQGGVIYDPLAPVPLYRLQWTFGIPVAISKTNDMASALSDLQRNLAQNSNGPRLSFTVQGTQVSQQLQESQTCSLPDLIADGRAQAQKLAGAAGLTLGNILAVSSSTTATSTGGSAYLGLPIGAFISSSTFAQTLTPPCFVTVKFAVR